MSITPITVYGAGIFGLSIAWALVTRGASVRVVDPHGVATGASGGIVGALAPHVPENWNTKKAFQFESLVRAETFWAEVAEVSGQDPGYSRSGRLQPVDGADLALAQARAASAKTLWHGKYAWQVSAADAHQAMLPPDTTHVIHDTLTARIHPRRATQALAAALVKLGATVQPDPPPHRGIEVWATGAQGLADLSEQFGQPVGTAIKGQAALFAADLRDQPQLFAEALHIVPHADGTTAIGSTSEREFTDPLGTDVQLDALIDKARALCPALANAPVRARWAGLRPRARSRAPMLGAHPDKPDCYIANGGFKIGFGMAPKAGDVLADLILDGINTIPVEFDISASLR